MCKIFERHVHVALYEYLNQYVLLFKYQTCFRPFYSCETVVIDLVEGLLMNMDNGLFTGLSLIVFRKAFDFVDHGVLLRNHSDCQLLEESIQCFKSYLEGRLQKVSINGVIPSSLSVTSGVPHGSILGPLLFISFINDLSLNVTKKSLYIYPDDTTQVVAGHNAMELASTLEENPRPSRASGKTKGKNGIKALNGLLPSYIAETFLRFSAVHVRETRNSKRHLRLPRIKQ